MDNIESGLWYLDGDKRHSRIAVRTERGIDTHSPDGRLWSIGLSDQQFAMLYSRQPRGYRMTCPVCGWFLGIQMLKMCWCWRKFWLGKRTWRVLFHWKYSETLCRYILARLDHYSPAEVMAKGDRHAKLRWLMEKYKISPIIA